MPNLEIKARYPLLPRGREIALMMGAKVLRTDHQVDTYFETRTGRLKLREVTGQIPQLIPYCKDYQAGPTRSDYLAIPITDPVELKALFTPLLGNIGVVEKRREILLFENVRIHLDEVEGLGPFLEFEAVFEDAPGAIAEESEKLARLMTEFGIRAEDCIDRSYFDLLYGEPALTEGEGAANELSPAP